MSAFQSLNREGPLEKKMVTHSNILAWKIPWMEEPGGLQSTGSQRVRHDWATSLSFTFHPFGWNLRAAPNKNLRWKWCKWGAKWGHKSAINFCCVLSGCSFLEPSHHAVRKPSRNLERQRLCSGWRPVMDWVSVSPPPPSLDAEALIPNVMIFEGGNFGQWLALDEVTGAGRFPYDEISAVTRRGRGTRFPLSARLGHCKPTASQEKGPHQEQVCWRLDLVFAGIRTGRNKHLLFYQPCLSVILGCAGNAQSHRGQHKPSDLCEQRFDDFSPGVLPSPASRLLLKPQGRDKVAAIVQFLSHV